MKSFYLHLITYTVSLVAVAHAQTALLFGSNGAVGSEVLRALLHNNNNNNNNKLSEEEHTIPPFLWKEVILIGRRLPKLAFNEDENSQPPKVTQVQMSSLINIEEEIFKQKRLRPSQRVDACIIAVGIGNPQEGDLLYWHSVEIEMIGAITRMCKSMGARYISLLSSIDAEVTPVPLSNEELQVDNNTNSDEMEALGWWKMLVLYTRMKGLSENAVIDNASAPVSTSVRARKDKKKKRSSLAQQPPTHVSIIQPCNIITETTRYGWLDWFVFKVHPLLDPWLPTRYHSIHVRFLGMAMAKDAANVIRHFDEVKDETIIPFSEAGVTATVTVVRRKYEDFFQIAGADYKESKNDVNGTSGEL